MEFLHSLEVVFLERKCLGNVMDLNLNHHSTIFRILWVTNCGDRRKLCVTIQGAVWPSGSGFLKSSQISFRHESTTDIVAEAINISALTHDGENDSSTEGPFQNSIVLSVHHANKKANVTSVSTINIFQEQMHGELVFLLACVNRRALERCYFSISGILEVMRETDYLPKILSTTVLN